MKQFFIILAFATTVIFSASALANSQDEQNLPSGDLGPVTLNENIIVSGSYVRLQDLFSNVPQDKAETAVAYAPKPGRRASFDARWLYRVARAYGLNWRPLSADLRTTVSRDSLVIEKQEIQQAIHQALRDYNLPQNPEIELSNRNLRLHVPANILAEVSIDDITYNQRTNRFAAVVSVGEKGSNPVSRVRVTGEVHSMLDVPTLAHRMQKGDVIGANDIAWVRLRADYTQRDVIIDINDLIGKTPRRHLRAEQPVRSSDIQEPIIVPKGDIVTIILRKPGLTLTSKGRAMENGSDGETIRVVNTKTNRTIDAMVIGSNTVTVTPNLRKSAQLAFNQ